MKNLRSSLYKNQRLIIGALIALCVLFADYQLFFSSLVLDMKEILPQVGRINSELATARASVMSMPRYRAQLADLRKRLLHYNKKFSTKQQIASLLEGLSAMAAVSGVKIISVKPRPAVSHTQGTGPAAAYQKFPISISARCGYHQLGSFLNKLENADTFMRITDIKITADPKNYMEHMTNIVVNTYILTEAKPQPGQQGHTYENIH